MSGKGDTRRPRQISAEEEERRWNATFGCARNVGKQNMTAALTRWNATAELKKAPQGEHLSLPPCKLFVRQDCAHCIEAICDVCASSKYNPISHECQ